MKDDLERLNDDDLKRMRRSIDGILARRERHKNATIAKMEALAKGIGVKVDVREPKKPGRPSKSIKSVPANAGPLKGAQS